MKLNLKVIESNNLPIFDIKGICDGYCKIQFDQQKTQTSIIDNFLTPFSRQDFSFVFQILKKIIYYNYMIMIKLERMI